MIEYKNVSKKYGSNIAVANISLKIRDGEFVFLVGPSGAGKSTFVQLLLKMVDADKGRIIYNGYDVTKLRPRMVPRHRRSMGIVFQNFSLLEKKTVFENVAFAMEIVQRPRRMIVRQVPQILELVGVKDLAKKYPTEISIGEQQRVAIARALMNNPDVLIADEPTGNLDPDTAWEIMHLLDQINRRGKTVLMVTHSREIVNAMNKRVIAIKDGRIVRDERGGFYHQDETGDDSPSPSGSGPALPI
jgi:cell division transport system ATP-binding protein